MSALATPPVPVAHSGRNPNSTATGGDGSGRLSVSLVRGRSVATEVHSRNPFRWLVPRSAALVHHGGIGTLSQGLAGGVPQVVMPMGFDQPLMTR